MARPTQLITPRQGNFVSFLVTSVGHVRVQRVQMKKMLYSWDVKYPGRAETIFRALSNAAPYHLMDISLFDFSGLRIDESSGLELSGIGFVSS